MLDPVSRLDATLLVLGASSGASPDGMQLGDLEEELGSDLERLWLPTGFPHEEGHKGHKKLVV